MSYVRDNKKVSDITQFKRSIIRMMYENPDIIFDLSPVESEGYDPADPSTIVNIRIFDRIRVPKIEVTAKAYIGIQAICPTVFSNDVYKQMVLTVAIFAHEDVMHVQGQCGNRIDLLGGDIVKMLNWDDKHGFDIKLISDFEQTESDDYYSRTIKFGTTRSNGVKNGVVMHD